MHILIEGLSWRQCLTYSLTFRAAGFGSTAPVATGYSIRETATKKELLEHALQARRNAITTSNGAGGRHIGLLDLLSSYEAVNDRVVDEGEWLRMVGSMFADVWKPTHILFLDCRTPAGSLPDYLQSGRVYDRLMAQDAFADRMVSALEKYFGLHFLYVPAEADPKAVVNHIMECGNV